MDLPLSLTSEDIRSFNQFWQSLAPDDRQAIDAIIERIYRDDLIAASRTNWPALKVNGPYLTYQTFLLAVIMEQHREIRGLRTQLEAIAKKPSKY